MSDQNQSPLPQHPSETPQNEIPEVIPEAHIAPEIIPESVEETVEEAVAPVSAPVEAPLTKSTPVKKVSSTARKKGKKENYSLLTVASSIRSLSMTFAAAVIVATIFMWWTSPDFLPARLRQGLARVQATPTAGRASPTPLPTPIWFNRIGVIAGHSGLNSAGLVDPGATCDDGFTELSVTTAIADRVSAILRGRGFAVDILEERDKRLEGYQAAALISLHADSCAILGYGGFKSAYPIVREAVRELDIQFDACIQANYKALTNLEFLPQQITPDMTEYHNWRKLNQTTPAVILELGFLSYDRDLLQNRQEVVAQAIVNGILCFLEPKSLSTEIAPTGTLTVPTPTVQAINTP